MNKESMMENVPAFGLDKMVKVLAKETTKILPFHVGGGRSTPFFNPEEYISQKVCVLPSYHVYIGRVKNVCVRRASAEGLD